LKPWANISGKTSWELDQAGQARRSLEKVRRGLISPSIRVLSTSASDLAVAVECLQKLERTLTLGPGLPAERRRSLESEMRALRRDLQEVTTLLAGVGKFYQGWARLISASADDAPANYTSRGTPSATAVERSGKVVAIG
jgi:hypothetical protein